MQGQRFATISPRGGFANKLIQFLVTVNLCEVLRCSLVATHVAEWGIKYPEMPPNLKGVKCSQSGMHVINFALLKSLLDSGIANLIDMDIYGQRMDNLPSVHTCRNRLPDQELTEVIERDELLCNIRGAEILQAVHPDYTLLPIQYYRDLERWTGLKLTFMGQLGKDRYSQALRVAFPKAKFVSTKGPMADFQTIRSARYLAPAVSTFSWLASWLSSADRIFLPVSGLLNPQQASRVDLLPLNDDRYRFVLFPINYSLPELEYEAAHIPMSGLWKEVDGNHLVAIRSRKFLRPRLLSDYRELFSESFYLKVNRSAALAVMTGQFHSGREHYENIGFSENLHCFPLDYHSYSRQRPVAALEVSNGEYVDFHHHYAFNAIRQLRR